MVGVAFRIFFVRFRLAAAESRISLVCLRARHFDLFVPGTSVAPMEPFRRPGSALGWSWRFGAVAQVVAVLGEMVLVVLDPGLGRVVGLLLGGVGARSGGFRCWPGECGGEQQRGDEHHAERDDHRDAVLAAQSGGAAGWSCGRCVHGACWVQGRLGLPAASEEVECGRRPSLRGRPGDRGRRWCILGLREQA